MVDQGDAHSFVDRDVFSNQTLLNDRGKALIRGKRAFHRAAQGIHT